MIYGENYFNCIVFEKENDEWSLESEQKKIFIFVQYDLKIEKIIFFVLR